MSRRVWGDLVTLTRSVEFAGAVPAIRRRAVEYVNEYKRVVAPIVQSTLGSMGPREYLNNSLCETSAKVCFMLAGYSDTANIPFRADIAVLGASVTRVYDDLVDNDADDELIRRISALFDGDTFTPASPVERLLHALYMELERRLGRSRHDPIYAALAAEHSAQVRSRRQRDPAIPSSVLMDITQEKGAHGTVVLFALMRPSMDDYEMGLIRELGTLLQCVDDYLDVESDYTAGIATPATRELLSLADICRRLRSLRPALRNYYGSDQPLFGVIYLYLWLGFFHRHRPRRLSTSSGRSAVMWLARVGRRA